MDWWLAGLGTVAGVVLILGFRKPSERSTDRWALRFGIVLDEVRWRQVAASHIRADRAMRSAGAAVGLMAASSPLWLTPWIPESAATLSSNLWVVLWLLPVALGAFSAIAVADLLSQPSDVADLSPREPSRYLDPRIQLFTRCVAVTAAAAALLASLAGVSDLWALGVAASACGVSDLLIRAGTGSISKRPTFGPDPLGRLVDEALRASQAHQLGGVCVALSMAGTALICNALIEEVQPGLGSLAFALSWLGIAFWWTIARDATWLGIRSRIGGVGANLDP